MSVFHCDACGDLRDLTFRMLGDRGLCGECFAELKHGKLAEQPQVLILATDDQDAKDDELDRQAAIENAVRIMEEDDDDVRIVYTY